jgi:BRCA1/BRCA2-containing complex subunit 3
MHVSISADVYFSCVTHALSTEREEIMGLLLGEMRDGSVDVCSLYMMRRSDKRPDRVEISPEHLSAAAIEAEALGERLCRPIKVTGWYHSHPHITVWPSHVGRVTSYVNLCSFCQCTCMQMYELKQIISL